VASIFILVVNPSDEIPIQPITVFDVDYEFWMFGAMTLILASFMFFYLMGHRIYKRK